MNRSFYQCVFKKLISDLLTYNKFTVEYKPRIQSLLHTGHFIRWFNWVGNPYLGFKGVCQSLRVLLKSSFLSPAFEPQDKKHFGFMSALLLKVCSLNERSKAVQGSRISEWSSFRFWFWSFIEYGICQWA